jgi:lipoprotein
MRKIVSLLVISLALVGCSKKSNDNSINGINIIKYNEEIANAVSLSDGIKESSIISLSDMEKIKDIYNTNMDSIDKTSIDITDDIKGFLDDLRTDIILKYNYKHYRNEFNGNEFYSDNVSVDRLTEDERVKALVLYRDIDNLWDDYSNTVDITEELLDRIYTTCDRYIHMNLLQKGLISNITKLGNMVENFDGSVDTNFNIAFWKWNIKKLAGEQVDAYNGPTNEELGIVQGRLMYGENPDGSPYVPITYESKATENEISETDNTESNSYDDYETSLIIPEDFYDCVVDEGSEGLNYVDENKLLEKVAKLDSSKLYIENSRIYIKANENGEPIQLLNWGNIEYYVPDNKYLNYKVKDYVYWEN